MRSCCCRSHASECGAFRSFAISIAWNFAENLFECCEMEPTDSKCYHLGGTISTASVGTQSGIGTLTLNTNNGNNNSNNTNNHNGNGPPNSSNSSNSGGGGTNTTNDELSQSTKSKAQLNSGNYLNIVPMPMGVQYHHRRKYSPQIQSDYQWVMRRSSDSLIFCRGNNVNSILILQIITNIFWRCWWLCVTRKMSRRLLHVGIDAHTVIRRWITGRWNFG